MIVEKGDQNGVLKVGQVMLLLLLLLDSNPGGYKRDTSEESWQFKSLVPKGLNRYLRQ